MHEYEIVDYAKNSGMYYGTQKLKIIHIFTCISVYIYINRLFAAFM